MSITNIITYLQTNLHKTDIKLYKGASETLIKEAEAALKVTLPEDFKIFYRFTNGFESDEDIFRIIPLEEMIENSTRYKHHRLDIAEYLIYIDTWYIRIERDKNEQYRICIMQNGEEIKLTNSFAVFLQKFLDGGVFEKGGLYDWAEQVKSQNARL